jgi:hypothetical protein
MIIATNRSLCSNSGNFTSILPFPPGQAWDFKESLFFLGWFEKLYHKSCVLVEFLFGLFIMCDWMKCFDHCYLFSIPQGYIMHMNPNPTEQEHNVQANRSILFNRTVGSMSYEICCIMKITAFWDHVRWVPCHHGMVRPQVADGEALQVRRAWCLLGCDAVQSATLLSIFLKNVLPK